jgi:hypothetical protein
MTKLVFRSFSDRQSDGWSPIVDSYRKFAPEFIASAAEDGEGRFECFPVYAMYIPNLLDDAHEVWQKVDEGLANGAYLPDRDILLIDCSWESWEFNCDEFAVVHDKLAARRISLERVALIQMCKNMPQKYADWQNANGIAVGMKIYSYWGAASNTGLHINAALGEDNAFDARLEILQREIMAGRKRSKRFLCMNNIVKPWRTSPAIVLWELAADKTYLSHAKLDSDPSDYEVWELGNWLGDPENVRVRRDAFAAVTPLILDSDVGTVEARSYTTFGFDPSYYETSAMSVVTESDMSSTGQLRATEKTYKPLAMGHPFLLCGNRGVLEELRKQGFQTFAPFLNEDYDLIDNGPERIQAVHRELKRLSELDDDTFYAGMKRVTEAVIHNMIVFRAMFNKLQWADLLFLRHNLLRDFPG